jgi:hypothetical protein
MTRQYLQDFWRIDDLAVSQQGVKDVTLVWRSTLESEIDPARTAYITTSSNSISSVDVNVERTSRRRSAAGANDRIERR